MLLPPLLPRLFTAASSARLSRDKTDIDAVSMTGGEVLELARPVRLRASVEVWVTSLEKELALTVRHAAQQYITDDEGAAAALDPANNPLLGAIQGCQPVTVAACELFWAQAAAAALREPTDGARRGALAALRFKLLEARAGCVGVLTRGGGAPTAALRSLHGALALGALSWSEVVAELLEAEAESEEAFAWQRVARYEWDEKSSMLALRVFAWHVQCGAEMLGPARLFVRVAASRRLWLALADTLRNVGSGAFVATAEGHGGGGPGRSGGGEAVGALAALAGVPLLRLDAPLGATHAGLLRLLSATAQRGAWLLLDTLHAAPAATLAPLAVSIAALHDALRARRPQVQLAGTAVALRPSAAVFASFLGGSGGGGGGAAAVPAALRKQLRPIALTQPEPRAVLEAVLPLHLGPHAVPLAQQLLVLRQRLAAPHAARLSLRFLLHVSRVAGKRLGTLQLAQQESRERAVKEATTQRRGGRPSREMTPLRSRRPTPQLTPRGTSQGRGGPLRTPARVGFSMEAANLMVGAAEREEAAEAESLRNGQQSLREVLEAELVGAAPPHERPSLRAAIDLALGGGGAAAAAAAVWPPVVPEAAPASPTADGAGGTSGGADDSDDDESAAGGLEGHGWVVPPPPLADVEAALARRTAAQRVALPSSDFERATAASLQARHLQPRRRFLGQLHELAQALQARRLVALVGPAGGGKSSLRKVLADALLDPRHDAAQQSAASRHRGSVGAWGDDDETNAEADAATTDDVRHARLPHCNHLLPPRGAALSSLQEDSPAVGSGSWGVGGWLEPWAEEWGAWAAWAPTVAAVAAVATTTIAATRAASKFKFAAQVDLWFMDSNPGPSLATPHPTHRTPLCLSSNAPLRALPGGDTGGSMAASSRGLAPCQRGACGQLRRRWAVGRARGWCVARGRPAARAAAADAARGKDGGGRGGRRLRTALARARRRGGGRRARRRLAPAIARGAAPRRAGRRRV